MENYEQEIVVSLESGKEKFDFIPIIVCIIFLGASLFIGFKYHKGIMPSAEMDGYLKLAMNSFMGSLLDLPGDEFRPYLYTFLTSVLGKVLGNYFTAGKLITIISATLLIYFSYLIGIKIYDNRWTAFAGIVLLSINKTFLFNSVLVATDVISAFLMIAVLYYSLCLLHSEGTRKYAVYMGIFFGLALSARYSCMFAFPAYLLCIILLKKNFREKIILVMIFGFLSLLFFSPALMINYIKWKNPFHNINWTNFAYKVFKQEYVKMKLDGVSSVIMANPHKVISSFYEELRSFKNNFIVFTGLNFLSFSFLCGLFLTIVKVNKKIFIVIFYSICVILLQCFLFFAHPRMFLPILPLISLFIARFIFPPQPIAKFSVKKFGVRAEAIIFVLIISTLLWLVTTKEFKNFKSLHNYDEIELAKSLNGKIKKGEVVMSSYSYMDCFVPYQISPMPPPDGDKDKDLETIITTMKNANMKYLLVSKQWLDEQRRLVFFSNWFSPKNLRVVEKRREAILFERCELFSQDYLEPLKEVPTDLKPGLKGFYYKNHEWEGEYDRLKIDQSIGHDWTDIVSRPYKDPFSILWKGFIEIPENGEYEFSLSSDDGSWIYLNSQEIIAHPGTHGPYEIKNMTINLKKGFYEILIKYFDFGFGACIKIWWKFPQHDEKLILASPYLWHNDTIK